MNGCFRIGDKVVHKFLGTGTVVKLVDSYCSVDGGRQSQSNPAYCRLRVEFKSGRCGTWETESAASYFVLAPKL